MLLFLILFYLSCTPGGEIPMAPGYCEVPMFIGAEAETLPLPPMIIPPHPYLAMQGKNGMHADSHCSGTYSWEGARARNPQVISLSMGLLGGLVATVAFDSQGHLMCVSGNLTGFQLLLLDSNTLEILASHPLPQRESTEEFFQTWDWNVIMSDTSGGAYFHLDHLDRPVIANADRIVQIFRIIEEAGTFRWQIDEEYDLNPALPEGALITDAMPDWDGNLWFITRGGTVGFIDHETYEIKTTDELINDEEEIQNAMAIAQDGVYIVSDYALYRFEKSAEGLPEYTWYEEYDRGTYVHPGAINQGSGTTPTLLGDDLIAITDNADTRVNVLVYKRRDDATGDRLICQKPIFDPNFSTSENSLIGYGRSIIAENNYCYTSCLPVDPSPCTHPGVTRIDVREDYSGCDFVWESREASGTTVPKLSIGNGLVYLYTRLKEYEGQPIPEDIMAWYLTAVDFNTGETVFKIFTGTGMHWNNSYGPITIGPNGTVYVGVFNGIIAIRDGLPGELERDLGCDDPELYKNMSKPFDLERIKDEIKRWVRFLI